MRASLEYQSRSVLERLVEKEWKTHIPNLAKWKKSEKSYKGDIEKLEAIANIMEKNLSESLNHLTYQVINKCCAWMFYLEKNKDISASDLEQIKILYERIVNAAPEPPLLEIYFSNQEISTYPGFYKEVLAKESEKFREIAGQTDKIKVYTIPREHFDLFMQDLNGINLSHLSIKELFTLASEANQLGLNRVCEDLGVFILQQAEEMENFKEILEILPQANNPENKLLIDNLKKLIVQRCIQDPGLLVTMSDFMIKHVDAQLAYQLMKTAESTLKAVPQYFIDPKTSKVIETPLICPEHYGPERIDASTLILQRLDSRGRIQNPFNRSYYPAEAYVVDEHLKKQISEWKHKVDHFDHVASELAHKKVSAR